MFELDKRSSRIRLKFTPLEFETKGKDLLTRAFFELKFTPLEFETYLSCIDDVCTLLKFTPLEFETTGRWIA